MEKKDTTSPPKAKLISKQEGKGGGVVATIDLKKGEKIVAYSTKPVLNLIDSGPAKFRYLFLVGDKYYDGSGPGCGLAAFINDSCDTKIIDQLKEVKTVSAIDAWVKAYQSDRKKSKQFNVDMAEIDNEGLFAFARRDIKAGEDLFNSYGEDYWIQSLQGDKSCSWETRLTSVIYCASQRNYPVVGKWNKLWRLPFNNYKGIPCCVCCENDDGVIDNSMMTKDEASELIKKWCKALGAPEMTIDEWAQRSMKAFGK